MNVESEQRRLQRKIREASDERIKLVFEKQLAGLQKQDADGKPKPMTAQAGGQGKRYLDLSE